MGNNEQRPLSGIRVVDFGQYIAGPAVGMMLADQGADVIHVDPPEGPRWNDPIDSILNRGKRRIRVDLKDRHQCELMLDLIDRSDVVVENFRPGVMARLGLGPHKLCERNPGLVYLSLPGFSGSDEELANIPAWEGVIAAAVGQFTDMGLNRILMGVNPSFTPLPLASCYASVLGSLSVTMALYAREQSGVGDIIEVPVSAALMEGLAYNSMHVEHLPDRYKSPRELEIERRITSGEPFDLSYDELQEFLDPFYRTYLCKDGRPFYVVCTSHTRHPIACLQLLGLWEEIRDARIPTHSPYLDLEDWPEGADFTLVSYPLSKDWASYVSDRMKTQFETKTACEWEELFGAARVPGCAVQLTEEWLKSKHALESGSILEVDDKSYGKMRQPGNICWLAGDNGVTRKQAAVDCDSTGGTIERLLQDWHRDTSVAAHTPPAGHTGKGWLEGLKVLDLTNVIAGPTAASTLARFGAEVVKIDPPEPTYDPWNTVIFGLQANRGKESLLLDLKSDDGKAVLNTLLKQVDVVVINATDDQLERLGLDAETLHQVNPELILCQIDAFGAPGKGPRSNYPGYDDLVQACTGIMARFGGGLATPEEHAHLGTIDVLCGYCAALAIGVALLERARGGGGSVARSSLVAAGQFIQAPFMHDYSGRAPFDEPSGPESKGADALYRCYKASDEWFFLAVDRTRKLKAFAAAIGMSTIGSINESTLERHLETLFESERLEYWQAVLRAADIGCQPLSSLTERREHSLLDESNALSMQETRNFAFTRHEQHPSGRRIDLVAPNAVRPAHARIVVPSPMPKYGEDTVSILERLGYSSSHVAQMIDQGTAATSWSRNYLPD